MELKGKPEIIPYKKRKIAIALDFLQLCFLQMCFKSKRITIQTTGQDKIYDSKTNIQSMYLTSTKIFGNVLPGLISSIYRMSQLTVEDPCLIKN